MKKRKDCIYYYYFEQTHSIYVGRTVDRKRRNKEHIRNIKKDTVAKYAYENGFKVPEMVIIEDDLTIEKGRKQEGFWENFYRKLGYNILNVAPAGSIGNFDGGIWDYDTCYKIALSCKTKSEFQKLNASAYIRATENGWIDDYTWFKNGHKLMAEKMIKWNYKSCYDLAKECKTVGEFRKRSSTAYEKARVNGWLKDYDWFIKPAVLQTKWNYDTCYEEAKKYISKVKFQKANGSAYGVARVNGWLKEYDWLIPKKKTDGYWNNYENCFEEAKKYKTRKEFKKGNGSAYKRALKNGWMDIFFSESKTSAQIIEQLTIDGQIINTYKSLCDTERKTGINRHNISACCKGKLKSAGGFIWKYAS